MYTFKFFGYSVKPVEVQTLWLLERKDVEPYCFRFKEDYPVRYFRHKSFPNSPEIWDAWLRK